MTFLNRPSWQTPSDGMAGSCIGEGGGSYGMGRSNHMLLMHHHNILASSYGGKNLTRFVVPHGATVFGPAYSTKTGSRTEPNGAVYAPLFMGPMPWTTVPNKVVSCQGAEFVQDLGVTTNYSCVATVDLGTSYGWYKGVNYAVWQGDTKHCHICNITGNSTKWNYTDASGSYSYVKMQMESDRETTRMLSKYDSDGDGRIDEHDLVATMNREDPPDFEDDNDNDRDDDGDDDDDDECNGDEECKPDGDDPSERGGDETGGRSPLDRFVKF